eukprot:2737167-Amphidinium_carterae.1
MILSVPRSVGDAHLNTRSRGAQKFQSEAVLCPSKGAVMLRFFTVKDKFTVGVDYDRRGRQHSANHNQNETGLPGPSDVRYIFGFIITIIAALLVFNTTGTSTCTH